MKQITKDQLQAMLASHKQWLACEASGQRADLSGANLRGANLSGAHLSDANLRYAILSGANLRGANLRGADLSGANLRDAILSGANLRYANLRGADLSGANLRYANLSDADLSDANLSGAHLDNAALPNAQIVPETGPFYGYKKLANGAIAELYIPRSAERVGGLIGRKCRASKAKVRAIYKPDGTLAAPSETFHSKHDDTFTYQVGQWVKPKETFNPDVREECTSGIHFFITRREAQDY